MLENQGFHDRIFTIKRLNQFLLLSTIISVITIKNSYSQEFDLSKRNLDQILNLEANSILIDTIDFRILKNPHNDINTTIQTKSLIFKRINDDFEPQLHMWYFFDKNLNKPKGLMYNWGLFNPSFNTSKNLELLEFFTKREKDFNKKFEFYQSLLTDMLGKPFNTRIVEDSKSKLVKQIFWVSDEKIVELSIAFMRELNEIPGIGILGDFHIQIMTTYR